MLTYIFASVYLHIDKVLDEKRCFSGHSRPKQEDYFKHAV